MPLGEFVDCPQDVQQTGECSTQENPAQVALAGSIVVVPPHKMMARHAGVVRDACEGQDGQLHYYDNTPLNTGATVVPSRTFTCADVSSTTISTGFISARDSLESTANHLSCPATHVRVVDTTTPTAVCEGVQEDGVLTVEMEAAALDELAKFQVQVVEKV